MNRSRGFLPGGAGIPPAIGLENAKREKDARAPRKGDLWPDFSLRIHAGCPVAEPKVTVMDVLGFTLDRR